MRYAQSTRLAQTFLRGQDTGVDNPFHRGTYGSCKSTVDAWMWEKNTTGFCWLEFDASDEVFENKQSRCQREFQVSNRDINVVEDATLPPPLCKLTLDCEMLVEFKFTDNE